MIDALIPLLAYLLGVLGLGVVLGWVLYHYIGRRLWW